jgi:hypothetical protein
LLGAPFTALMGAPLTAVRWAALLFAGQGAALLIAVPRAAPPFAGLTAALPLADPMAEPHIARRAVPIMAVPITVPLRFIAGVPTTVAPELRPVWRLARQRVPQPPRRRMRRRAITTIRRPIITRRRISGALVSGPHCVIDGAVAAALGLVNRVVEDEALCGETAALDHDRWQIGSSLSVKICV